MKRIIRSITIIITLCCMGWVSCVDLDLEPKGQFGEAEFFGSEAGVKIYFAGLYGWLPIEDFHYMHSNDGGYRNKNGDDAWSTWEAPKQYLQKHAGEFINSWDPRLNNDGPNYWPYDRIRDVNVFINNFENYRNEYSEASFNALLGEARFLRAFLYSGMVKRFGGVPIIREVQYPNDPPEKINVRRDTEYDCWKFIYEDLDFACKNMTDKPDLYRATKWTALALQSRLMLYAGSIAKYSKYLNYGGQEEAYNLGLAGISEDKANEFFQYAYDAANELIDEGPYTLYNKYADKAENFYRLFLDIKSEKEEVIFIRNYIHHDLFGREAYLIGHNWDALMSPKGDMSMFVGGQNYPSLDMMRLYEGFPDLVDANGNPKRWANPGDIREGMEPRMRGSMYFNGDQLRGATFDIRRGIYKTFRWPASEIKDGTVSEIPNDNGNRLITNSRTEAFAGKNVVGKHGMLDGGGEDNCLTGAFVRKYINEEMPLATVVEHASFQPWAVFRLGEIYLNFAEAAYELGKKAEANEKIRAIRERAGCVKPDISEDLADVNQYEYQQTLVSYVGGEMPVGLQFIRDERNRELWGENHRWWDLRRWRTAERVLERWAPRILSCYWIVDEDAYIYLDEREMANRQWNFEKKAYYQGISDGEINRNPNLLPRNPLR